MKEDLLKVLIPKIIKEGQSVAVEELPTLETMPLKFVENTLVACGWKVVLKDLDHGITDHPLTFFLKHDPNGEITQVKLYKDDGCVGSGNRKKNGSDKHMFKTYINLETAFTFCVVCAKLCTLLAAYDLSLFDIVQEVLEVGIEDRKKFRDFALLINHTTMAVDWIIEYETRPSLAHCMETLNGSEYSDPTKYKELCDDVVLKLNANQFSLEDIKKASRQSQT